MRIRHVQGVRISGLNIDTGNLRFRQKNEKRRVTRRRTCETAAEIFFFCATKMAGAPASEFLRPESRDDKTWGPTVSIGLDGNSFSNLESLVVTYKCPHCNCAFQRDALFRYIGQKKTYPADPSTITIAQQQLQQHIHDHHMKDGAGRKDDSDTEEEE